MDFLQAMRLPKPALIKQAPLDPLGPDPLATWHAAIAGKVPPAGSSANERAAATWFRMVEEQVAARAEQKEHARRVVADRRVDRAAVELEWAQFEAKVEAGKS